MKEREEKQTRTIKDSSSNEELKLQTDLGRTEGNRQT
jgi:hypothetical protein